MRLLLLLPLLLAGCGSPVSVASQEVLHTGSGTVLQSPAHGPELCFDVMQSLPPQCSGIPLLDWDWAQVDGEESANGSTWGEYALTGRWDGTALTVTETAAPPSPRRGDLSPFEPGCEDPKAGGTGGIAQDDIEKTISTAQTSAEYAGGWIGSSTLTLAFTDDLERHEQRARTTWSGPLCVVQHDRSLRELRRIQDELRESGRELGLEVRSSSTLEVENLVEIGVFAVTPEQQRALAERYGEGVVRVVPGLREVR